MHKRSMLFAAPVCVAAIMATVAGAVPSGAAQARGPKLDKLHAVRPTAAMSSVLVPNRTRSVEVGKKVDAVRTSVKARAARKAVIRRRLRAYVAAVSEAQVAAQVQAVKDEPAAAAAPAVVDEPVSSGGDPATNPGDFLSCVRNRESGGDYRVRNQGDSGAAGAYQFLQGTWDSIAASRGRFDLVGIDPAQASPGDQDAMAQALYAQQGAAPWGGGCS
jgi:ribosomal protein L36